MLDDLHVIESTQIHEQLGYFLERLPAGAHIVIGTRADPPIPLSRLRARGALVELRASDLRFSADEAATYLGGDGALADGRDVATLEARTEGWIAALQLAALSLQGRDDPTAFIAAFAGDDRYIVDYLVEEVLRRQPPRVRDFLLQTSILTRITGSLADAVTGRAGGARTIEALDRANLFVVALDDQRRWYRYHHLFGGVLQADLAAEQPDEVPRLHRRASDWYAEHDEPGEAVEHALRAGDPDHAADLVELAMTELSRFRREPTLRRWIDAIPREVVARRPALAVAYAGTILSANEVTGVEELLDGAETRLSRACGAGAASSTDEGQRLRAMVELYRAAVAKMRGDLEGNLAHARRVLDIVGDSDHMGRGGAAAFLGLAYWGMGEVEAGDRWYAEGMASLEKAGRIADLVGGSVDLLTQNLDRFKLAGLAPAPRNATDVAATPITRGHNALLFCKKNAKDLAKAITAISNVRPVIVIDDEADYATPNAKINQAEQTKINKLVSNLLGTDGVYIGVTATPARLNLNNTFNNRTETWVRFRPHPAYTGPDIFLLQVRTTPVPAGALARTGQHR